MAETSTIAEAPIRVACEQMEPKIGETISTLRKSEEMIHRAEKAGVRLTILPELAISVYMFSTRDEAFGLSEQVPRGETCELWGRLEVQRGAQSTT